MEVFALLLLALPCTIHAEIGTDKPVDATYDHHNGSLNSNYGDQVVDDTGKVAWIVIGVLAGVVLVGAVIGVFVYKQYVRRNVKSMNFDNPVYRKTTEDQFSLEKNQYQPARSYPAVSEETLEPLNNPGTNEFV